MTATIIDIASPLDRAPRHRWGERVSVLENTASGCEQGERTCVHCGMVRVTVHPPHGRPWRAWRPKAGPQMDFDGTPPCPGQPSPLSGEDDSSVSGVPEVSGVNPHESRNPQGHRS